MGVGGKFWDLLKPYARHEGPDFLRDKRVAVDLSYWIVQHETAIKSYARNPHLRLTFFRTVNLFSKFGAFPVFVVDGTPSPLKSRARIAGFFRFSGVDVSRLAAAEEGVPPERNRAFMKCVQECVELLELFGMPVLHAKGEAEALCAQLNSEGHVDACITADSDAFLFGAKCVIKCLKPNTKEPFECYHMLDIETGLGLKRKQLVAISLLVGNDHDLNGVQGIGIETALRFVQSFTEDEILDRLNEAGNGNAPALQGCSKTIDNFELSPGDSPVRTRSKALHCSFCGHPGSKRVHLKSSCELCGMNGNLGCQKKPGGFKCGCFFCDKDRKEKEMQKHENWNIKVCDKIAKELNFPNDAIINVYLSDSHGNFSADDGPALSWGSPNTDMLVDFLVFHQHWEPSYIRQRMIPMLSTVFLREMAAAPDKKLLHDQYEFDSIQRVKIRYGQQSYVVKWKKAAPLVDSAAHPNPVEKSDKLLEDVVEVDEAGDDHLDEDGATQIHVEDGFLLTDENMDLVHGAFPDEVDRFLHEKEIKDSKRRKCSTLRSDGSTKKSESSMSKGIQLNITEFYRSSKSQARQGEDAATNSENQDEPALKEKRKIPNSSLPKSVRRRLLLS